MGAADTCGLCSIFLLTKFFLKLVHEEGFILFSPKILGGGGGVDAPKPSCQLQPYFVILLKTNGGLHVGQVMHKNRRSRRRNVACIRGNRAKFQLQQVIAAYSNAFCLAWHRESLAGILV
jgi:hypothetical protein